MKNKKNKLVTLVVTPEPSITRKVRKVSTKAIKRGYTLPVILTCQVTGKSVKYTNTKYIDKAIEKHDGSLAMLQATYVSREGKQVQKAAHAAAVAAADRVYASAHAVPVAA